MSFIYEIRLRGRLSSALLNQFEQLELVPGSEPVETLLQGPVEDQAALHGLLRRIEALGLELIELRRLPGPTQPRHPQPRVPAEAPPWRATPVR
ncbi:MAG TPA: hypothetical protein VK611_29030 [Acidimicrobiales bacterium]|nr:hypothetical protein [Acidimicrobiales bacterium]